MGVFIWVPLTLLPWLGVYHRFRNEVHNLVLPARRRLAILVSLFLLAYASMAATYLVEAHGVEAALGHYYSSFLGENLFYLVLPVAFFGWLPSHFFKTYIEGLSFTDAIKTCGSFFALSPLWLWIAFLFVDAEGRLRESFTKDFPGAVFNLDAYNFVTFSLYCSFMLCFYLIYSTVNRGMRTVIRGDLNAQQVQTSAVHTTPLR